MRRDKREIVAVNRAGHSRASYNYSLSGIGAELSIHCIRIREIVLIVVNKLQVVFARNVVIEPYGREPSNVFAGVLESIIQTIEIALSRDATLQCAGGVDVFLNYIQHIAHCRINRPCESFRPRKIKHIHISDCAGCICVGEVAQSRLRRQHQHISYGRALRSVILRQGEVFVVDEEESFFAIFPQSRNDYRSAEIATVLAKYERIARQAVNVVEIVIRVKGL